MGQPTVQPESIDAIWDEMIPLMQQHWAELNYKSASPLQLDRDAFRKAEQADQFILFTLRDDGELIGYAGYAFLRDVHQDGELFAKEEGLFVVPHRRKGTDALRLVRESVEALSDFVAFVAISSPAKAPIGSLLERAGFKQTDVVYTRRFDACQSSQQSSAVPARR